MNSGTTNGGGSIRAQKTADPPAFNSTSGNLSTRPTTNASEGWSPPSWSKGSSGNAQKTENFAAVIQEVIDETAWASGNAIVVIITGSGERVAESFNGSPEEAPLLHIEFHP